MIKEILSNKRCWIILLISTAFTIFLTYPFSTTQFNPITYAGTDTDANLGPKALWNPYTGSWYITNDASGQLQQDLAPAVVRVRFHSAGDSVTWFRFRFQWDPDSLSLLNAVNTGYNYPPGFSFDTTRLSTNNKFQVTGVGGSAVLDSANTMFALKFKILCLTDGAIGTAITMDTTDATGVNTFVIGGSTYRPANKREGKVSIPLDSLSISPGKDTVIIDSTFYQPIYFTTNFAPSGGFRDTFVLIDSLKLEYKGIDKNYTATHYATLIDSVSTGGGTIMVKTSSDNVPPGNNEVLFYLKTKNKMTANKQWAKVKVKYAKFNHHASCNKAFAEQTIEKVDSVLTLYEATASLENETTPKNANDSLEVFLKNNFQVLMTALNPEEATRAHLKIDTTWTRTGFATIPNPPHKEFTGWNWEPKPQALGILFREDPGEVSNHIPVNVNPDTIFRLLYTAGNSAGTRTVDLRVDSAHHAQLTDWYRSNPVITIRHTSTSGPNNTISFVSGSINIPNPPPGGSCPFLYTWNGNQFLEDNDILTTSEFTLSGTPVTDHYKISQPLVETNGQYLLQLREVQDEESFVDELALITVDHPQSVKVGVTPEGKIVAYDKALFPVACVDQEGNDHLDKILTNDGVIFEGEGPAALLLTFNNPSKKELPNDIRPEGAPGDDGNGPPPPKDGFGLSTKLTVEIEDASGQWHDLGVVAPRVNAQGSCWILGSTGIDLGEQFRVKLYWDKRYSVDRLAYYVPTAKPWYQESLRLTQAGHSKKMDVTSLVSAYDGNSAKLIPGEVISLAFPVGKPVPDGMVRDFIFKAVGYYTPYDRASSAGSFTYKLHNNYPNPFNAQTEIQYALPEPSEVNLSVYNIMGQKVRTLVEGRQFAGVHMVTWDGKNENGETVASGVYFYTIRAGTYLETKKMTLLK